MLPGDFTVSEGHGHPLVWLKVQNGTFGFQGHGRSVDCFWGQEFAILLKEVPATLSRNFLDIFSEKSPHFKEEIYDMAKLLGNNNNSWQIW